MCLPRRSGVPEGGCNHPQQTGQSLGGAPGQEQHCKVKLSTKNTSQGQGWNVSPHPCTCYEENDDRHMLLVVLLIKGVVRLGGGGSGRVKVVMM